MEKKLQIVNSKIATLLKSLGFNWKGTSYISSTGSFWHDMVRDNYNVNAGDVSLPTQALVVKWLRDIYNIHIYIIPNTKWIYCIYNMKTKEYIWSNEIEGYIYNSVEQATDAGILKAIEMIQNQKLKPDESDALRRVQEALEYFYSKDIALSITDRIHNNLEDALWIAAKGKLKVE